MSMSIRSVLLRLSLSLVLLLGGTTTAVASVNMSHLAMAEAASQVISATNADGEDEIPCHDANEAKVAIADPDSGGYMHGFPEASTPPPDCCASGVCSCACMHLVHAAAVPSVLSVATIEHNDSVRPLFSVHASPALSHLLRPPIS